MLKDQLRNIFLQVTDCRQKALIWNKSEITMDIATKYKLLEKLMQTEDDALLDRSGHFDYPNQFYKVRYGFFLKQFVLWFFPFFHSPE